ncbi:MAG: M18 family aminopeptidase [Gammaproteobacteria bacterium]|nr:M18 family aminopeptidase [Gammaproteobacteria bacterium]
MAQNKTKTTFNTNLFTFLADSPTPFHAVQTSIHALEKNGFVALIEDESWQLSRGKKYYVTRNESSIIAFTLGKNFKNRPSINMIGAHTDSPCLKIKPNPERTKTGYFQLGVEVYGGALLNPWFDRDLSLAGRVSYENSNGELKSALIDFKEPIAIIPSLAIHLDKDANKNRTINKQNHLPPILGLLSKDKTIKFVDLLQKQINSQYQEVSVKQILDHELFFYDTQKPAYVGLNQEFIASARLDNLLSCYTGLTALLDSDDTHTNLLMCSDHEEVGSASSSGAHGPFLKSVLERLCGAGESLTQCMHRSFMISADNAHGIHPNYPDKHDDNHGPIFNSGPVIKLNANQRYATNSETSALFKLFCKKANVPFQSFVVRSDMGCGSTIGPITAAELGVKTVDIGLPTFAMHSIRELAGADDAFNLYQVFINYFKHGV